jgi:hypothetical protein
MRPERVFLDVIGTKKLKTFAPCYSQSPSTNDFTPLYSFLGLEIQKAIAESGWGLCFVYKQQLLMYQKEENLYHLYGFRNPYKTINE